MNYGYKPTTNGRELLAACAATGKGLDITRVAVGSGRAPEGVDLADVHALFAYVADGTISRRAHENDRLYLTVQYSNADPEEHKTVPTFMLAEFMVYAAHPETGEETDLLYATLGDYLQTIPAYNAAMPPSVFSFPLTLVISDEIEVAISASAGLVTYDELDEAVAAATKDAMDQLQPGWACCGSLQLTIPADGWKEADEPTADYAFICDVPAEGVTSGMIPDGAPLPGYFHTAQGFKMMGGCDVLNGAVRFYAKDSPSIDIPARINLFRMGGSGGGGGSVDPGVGLGFGMDGKLNVLLGDGLSNDSENRINVDHTEVVTDDDMVDEEQAARDIAKILSGGDSASPAEKAGG